MNSNYPILSGNASVLSTLFARSPDAGKRFIEFLNSVQLTQAKSIVFRTVLGRTEQLSDRPMSQADAYIA